MADAEGDWYVRKVITLPRDTQERPVEGVYPDLAERASEVHAPHVSTVSKKSNNLSKIVHCG